MLESPRESKMNRRRGAAEGDCRVKSTTPVCRTATRVAPAVVGSSCAELQLGFEKMIHPACQSSPEVAHVGVPPVSAFAVLADMHMVTQLFRLIASILARDMSFVNSAVMAPTWFRTTNSFRLGTPTATITAKTATVTISSMMVKPASQVRRAALVGRRRGMGHTVIRMS